MRVRTTAKLQTSSNSSASITFSDGPNYVAGNSAVFSFVHYNASGSPTDRIASVTIGGTSAVKVVEISNSATDNFAEIWVATNIAGSNNQVVLTRASGSNGYYITGAVEERDDILVSGYLDQTGTISQNTSSTPTVSLSANTTQARELLSAIFCDYVGTAWTSSTPPTNWTEIWEDPNGNVVEAGSNASFVTTSTGPQTAAFTTGSSVSWIAAMVSLKLGPFANAHGLTYDFVGAGGSSITSPAMDTTGGGGIMLALMGRGVIGDYATAVVNDNQGNGSYSQVGTSHAYTAWPTSGTAVFQKTNPTGGASHTVSATKPTTSDEVTLFALHVANVNTIVDVQWNEDLTTSTNTSANITTTGQATLVAFWAGADTNGELNPAVSSGWTVLDHTSSLASNHVQGAVAVRNVPGAGTYNVVWTPSTPQAAQLWIFALQDTVASGPTVNTDPTDQTVDKGVTATFSVTATTSGGSLSYQWQDDSSGSFANISGATSSSYGIAATYAMQGRQYRCVVTDSNGSTTSASAKLIVRSNLVDTGPRVIPVFGAPFGHSIHGWIQGTLSSSGASGTLSVTEGHDTLAASGTTTVVGNLAKTNQNDTVSAAATPVNVGTLARTNQNDSLAAAGTPVNVSTFSSTNANDSLNASGAIGSAASGTANVSGGNDTLSASGTPVINSTVAAVSGNDGLAASGNSAINSSLAVTGGNDTLSALSSSQLNATVGISEFRDTLNAAGNVAIPSTFASTNRNDTLLANGNVTITSTLAVTENHDNLNASGVSGTPPVGGNAFWRFMGLVLGRMRL